MQETHGKFWEVLYSFIAHSMAGNNEYLVIFPYRGGLCRLLCGGMSGVTFIETVLMSSSGLSGLDV